MKITFEIVASPGRPTKVYMTLLEGDTARAPLQGADYAVAALVQRAVEVALTDARAPSIEV